MNEKVLFFQHVIKWWSTFATGLVGEAKSVKELEKQANSWEKGLGEFFNIK